MKKSIVAALLGIVSVTKVFGFGTILFDNYSQGTYNQVCWPDHTAVMISLPLQLYYQEGTGFTDLSQLTPGITTTVNTFFTSAGANGPGGWFGSPTQALPTWQSGDVFTFCVVAPGYIGMQSAFWTETSAIHDATLPVSGFLNFPGINVPEPSAFVLFGAAGVALAVSRNARAKRYARLNSCHR